MLPWCRINVSRVLLLAITNYPICSLHTHYTLLETPQDVYWGCVVVEHSGPQQTACTTSICMHGHRSSLYGFKAISSISFPFPSPSPPSSPYSFPPPSPPPFLSLPLPLPCPSPSPPPSLSLKLQACKFNFSPSAVAVKFGEAFCYRQDLTSGNPCAKFCLIPINTDGGV